MTAPSKRRHQAHSARCSSSRSARSRLSRPSRCSVRSASTSPQWRPATTRSSSTDACAVGLDPGEQPHAGPMQTGADRGVREAGDPRRLVDGEVLAVAEGEELAVLRRERREGGLDGAGVVLRGLVAAGAPPARCLAPARAGTRDRARGIGGGGGRSSGGPGRGARGGRRARPGGVARRDGRRGRSRAGSPRRPCRASEETAARTKRYTAAWCRRTRRSKADASPAAMRPINVSSVTLESSASTIPSPRSGRAVKHPALVFRPRESYTVPSSPGQESGQTTIRPKRASSSE